MFPRRRETPRLPHFFSTLKDVPRQTLLYLECLEIGHPPSVNPPTPFHPAHLFNSTTSVLQRGLLAPLYSHLLTAPRIQVTHLVAPCAPRSQRFQTCPTFFVVVVFNPWFTLVSHFTPRWARLFKSAQTWPLAPRAYLPPHGAQSSPPARRPHLSRGAAP